MGHAPVKIIVEEAGGRFSDFRGGPRIDTGQVVATNGRIHDEVLELLRLGARHAGGHMSRQRLSELLAESGFIAPDEEAEELLACVGSDLQRLRRLVARRLTGEPLAWITGAITFCGIRVNVDDGVYVPRPHTEQLAERAAECLPDHGTAIDICTGSGAVAKVMMSMRRGARVLASDIDERAVACAAHNGVEVHQGDLLAPFLSEFGGRVDVVVGSPPYVPTSELGLLQRDTFVFESALAYDGGPEGTTFLRRAIAEASRLLRNGGTLLLELGGGQAGLLQDQLSRYGYRKLRWFRDEEGDLRGLEAKLIPRSGVCMPNERGC